jgi:hypothetical protein
MLPRLYDPTSFVLYAFTSMGTVLTANTAVATDPAATDTSMVMVAMSPPGCAVGETLRLTVCRSLAGRLHHACRRPRSANPAAQPNAA